MATTVKPAPATNKKALPAWKKVFEGYPKNAAGTDDLPAPKVFASVFGPDYDKEKFQNACAVRLSLALINGGIAVKKDWLIQLGPLKGKGFISATAGMQKWLTATFGVAHVKIKDPKDLAEVQAKIGNRNGIYIILRQFSDASGHCTLWRKDTKDAMGGHNYITIPSTIHFWELK